MKDEENKEKENNEKLEDEELNSYLRVKSIIKNKKKESRKFSKWKEILK